MQLFRVQNITRPLKTAIDVRSCDRFLDRFRGLMLHPPLKADEGIVLVQKKEDRMGASIHMLFMRMDLAVVWLNSNWVVVDIKLARRWRFAYVPEKPAMYVLELAAGHFSSFQVGDQVALVNSR